MNFMLNGGIQSVFIVISLISSPLLCAFSLQAASVGAILNILGPTLSPEQLPQLRQSLTDGIVMGVVNSCLFDPLPI